MPAPPPSPAAPWSGLPNRGEIGENGWRGGGGGGGGRAGGEAMPEQAPGPPVSHRPGGASQQPGSSAALTALVPGLTEVCGPDSVITAPLELRTYECDGLTAHRCSPGLVVLPETATQVAAVVRACAAAGIPFVAR